MKMSPRRLALCGMATAVLASGCVAQPKPQLRVDAGVFATTIRTVCVENVTFEIEPVDREATAKQFAFPLARALEARSFSVVPAETVQRAWESSIEAAGGLVDPLTGRTDSSRLRQVWAAYRRTLASDHGCDATLSPQVALVTATFAAGKATWDGVEATMPSSYKGYLPALSFFVEIKDLEGKLLYFGSGGIELLSRLDVGFWSTDFEHMPREALLRDIGRCTEAIHQSLIGLPSPPST